MAKESERDKPVEELKAEIARSRERVARDFRDLRYELDFPRRIRTSFQRQTVVWIAAAAVIGVLLTILPTRKKKVYVDAKGGSKPKGKLLEAGFALAVARIAASLLKPVIVSFITKKIGGCSSGARPAKK